MSEVTCLLDRAQQGDPKAAAELLPLVYDELRRLAASVTANLAAGTLSPAVSNAIGGLLPGTLYHFRLVDANSMGINAGPDLSFTTAGFPLISGLTQLGTNLNFTFTGGSSGGDWTLITATDVTLPADNWSTNVSGVFDALGNVTLTNGINSAIPQLFYRLRCP